MKPSMWVRLCLMMFLQYFTWGSWFDTIPLYMSQHGMADLTQWPYTMYAIASLVSPFIVGLIADRIFATERVLAVLHLAAGAIMLALPQFADRPVMFIAMLGFYNVFYMPTVALAASLAFKQITNQEKEFPIIRVFGTIAWIAAGLFISFGIGRMLGVYDPFITGLIQNTPAGATPPGPESSFLTLTTTGISGLVLGLYSLTLPHTPPPAKGQPVSFRSIAGLDALKTMGSRSFYVLVACALLIWVPLAAYYNFLGLYMQSTGMENIAATQKLGQASEVIFMLLMPFFFRKLGVKWMIGVGMLAWVLRYALFAIAAPGPIFWMIIVGILLHGICFDFFFVTLQIYIDKRATPEIRSQAQGFLVLVTYGIGFLIGSQVNGLIYNRFLAVSQAADPTATVLSAPQFATFWWFLAACAAAVMVLFFFMFKDDSKEHEQQKFEASNV